MQSTKIIALISRRSFSHLCSLSTGIPHFFILHFYWVVRTSRCPGSVVAKIVTFICYRGGNKSEWHYRWTNVREHSPRQQIKSKNAILIIAKIASLTNVHLFLMALCREGISKIIPSHTLPLLQLNIQHRFVITESVAHFVSCSIFFLLFLQRGGQIF